MLKVLMAVTVLGASWGGGCDGCGSGSRPVVCDQPNESFDGFGQCCDNAQQVTDEHGERVCDFDLPIPDRSDAGHVPACEENETLICARMVGSDAGDGGTCACVPEIVVGCPTGQYLSPDKKECLYVNPPDAGTPECPDPIDAGSPCAPDERMACLSSEEVDAGIDAGTCTVTTVVINCGREQTYNAFTDHCDDNDPLVCPDPPDAGSCPTLDGGTCPVCPTVDGGTCPTCPIKCPSSQTLNGAGTRCVDTVRVCGDDFTAHCGANNLDQLMSSDCSCSEPPAPCEICPTPVTCKTCDAPGSYLDTRANPPACYTPPPAPLPTLEVAFLVSPSMASPAIAAPNQTGVNHGSIVLRGPAGKTVEASNITLAALVADDPAGSYTLGTSGSVRATDRYVGCTLKDWPPLSGVFGPVAFAADGTSSLLGPITLQGMRGFNIQCDFTNAPPVGDTDGFAVDVDSLQGVVVEPGGARTAMTAVVMNRNGPSPLVAIQVGCAYVVLSSSGTTHTVKTKPSFSLSPGSPSGTKPTGWGEAWRIRVYVPSCAGVTWNTFSFGVSYTDVNNTRWADNIINSPSSNVKLTNVGNLQSPIGTLQIASFSAGRIGLDATFSNGGVTIPAGTPAWEASIWINTAGASSGDRLQIHPGANTIWKGADNPSGYPAIIQAPDLAAASGNAITF